LQKIQPSPEQKKLFKTWTDASRYVFNRTIDYLNSCVNFTPSWMDVKKDLLKQLPAWCDAIPFQIKGMAVKEACGAFWAADNREPKFRSRKAPEQSCFIPKSALSEKGIYPRISGKGLRFTEPLPENPMDSRLIWRFNAWWLSTPHKCSTAQSENQGRIVALDPGVRTFMAFYSPDFSGKIGEGGLGRIQRLCFHLDKLFSKRSLSNNSQKKRSLTKAIRRMQQKIKNLIDELHHKTARFLTDNFDCILLPTFETKDMALKAKRKIRSKTVRSMLTFAHYRFKMFLKWKASQRGKTVLDVTEEYTSKTHPQTGEVRNIGGAKRIPLLNGSWADRDVTGAFNVLLKALTDSSTPVTVCS
jgi:putative transposase